ncbi:MAG: GNAT family N-acetyltransferase [Clostridiales bacterium]|nr:GNAT family N-acetyltransferase [Clostridiales bacterium]
MIQKLNIKDFDRLYEIMEMSFPMDEYRSYQDQKALLRESSYYIYVVYDEESEIKAFMAIWDFDKFVFIEHFAVNPAYRNNGVGEAMLREMVRMLGKTVCLEVEPPDTDIASRRIGFYKRNNFVLNNYPYIQPALGEGRSEIPLIIMTSPSEVDEETFEEIKENLYRRVYKIG